MDKDYRTEEGYILEEEDVIGMIRWMLINGKSISELRNFDESEMWQKNITKITIG
jgi:hypothetical protein